MTMEQYLPYIFGDKVDPDYVYVSNLKLRDFLVPISKSIEQAKEMERCSLFDLDYQYVTLDEEHQLVKKNIDDCSLFAVEYSYDKPVRPEYLDMEIQDITDETLMDWINAINNRILPIINSSVPQETIDLVDNNSDVSCFLHLFSGQIDIFDNTDIDEVITAKFDSELFNIAREYKLHPDKPSRSMLQNSIVGLYRLMPDDSAVMLTYQIHYSKPKEDVDSGNKLWNYFPIELGEKFIDDWSVYILNMIRNRATVIVVP